MNNQNQAFIPLAALIAAVGFAGCAANKTALKHEGSNEAAASAGEAGGAAANSEEPSVRGNVLSQVPEVDTVHFAYDSATLDVETRSTLKKNAQWLKEHAVHKIQIAGYCDERGTVEYNLALGQRRASAVRGYYHLLGIPLNHIATISYGKERPLCTESTEACWAKNRRADTLVAGPVKLIQRQSITRR